MRRYGRAVILVLAVFLFASTEARAFTFGPKPTIYLARGEDQARFFTGMYSYNHTAIIPFLDTLSVADRLTDYGEGFHELHAATSLGYGINTALSVLTSRFNQLQEAERAYTETRWEVRVPWWGRSLEPTYLYGAYHRLHNDGLPAEGLSDYLLNIDKVRLGYLLLETAPRRLSEYFEVYAGLTYCRLRSSGHGTNTFGVQDFEGHTIGLTAAGSGTFIYIDGFAIRPALVLGYSLTFLSLSYMSVETTAGTESGLRAGASALGATLGAGMFDQMLQMGLNLHLGTWARLESLFYLDGMSLIEGSYEAFSGRAGASLSLEIEL